MSEDMPDWFNKRDRSPLSRIFEELERMMVDALPEEVLSERELPDGSSIKEFVPFTYGYSIRVGPDGEPHIEEFGNIKPLRRPQPFHPRKPNHPPFEDMEILSEKEPLIDVFTKNNEVKVIVEMPEVQESEIALECTGRSITIIVNKDKRREIELPVKVEPKSQRFTYKNGILEITLNKQNEPDSKIKWL